MKARYSNEQIIEMIKSGRQKDFQLLRGRFDGLFITLTPPILQNNRTDLEEILLHVWAKIYMSIHTFNPIMGEFVTWAGAILKNYAIDVLRSSDFKNKMLNESVSVHIHDTCPNPETCLLLEETKEKVVKACTRLPADLQTILHMYHFENLQYEEIAEKLHMPCGTVKSKLFKARMNLADVMKLDVFFANYALNSKNVRKKRTKKAFQ